MAGLKRGARQKPPNVFHPPYMTTPPKIIRQSGSLGADCRSRRRKSPVPIVMPAEYPPDTSPPLQYSR